MRCAVQSDGGALRYASERLRNDKKIVLEAVTNNGMALEFASEALKDNFKIVKIATKSKGASIRHASARLQRNRFIILSSYDRLDFYSRIDVPDLPIFGHEKSLPGQQKLSALLTGGDA